MGGTTITRFAIKIGDEYYKTNGTNRTPDLYNATMFKDLPLGIDLLHPTAKAVICHITFEELPYDVRKR